MKTLQNTLKEMMGKEIELNEELANMEVVRTLNQYDEVLTIWLDKSVKKIHKEELKKEIEKAGAKYTFVEFENISIHM